MNSNSNLYYALKEVIIDPASKYMSEIPDINHRFSRKYKRNIALLLGRVEAVNRSIKINFKIAVCIAAAVIGFGASTVVGGDIKRDWTIEKTEIIDNRQGAVDLHFIEGDFDGHQAIREPNMCFPTYITEGFELNEEMSVPEDDYFYFENGDKRIIYSENPLSTTISIDNEHTIRKKTTINGCEAELFVFTDYECATVVWQEELTIYEVYGDLEESEVIKIAESVQRRK